ncbi:MAG TPA: hypothetical protein HA349_10980 [Methanotrichaceae archaeon]|nr:hypothetical protein [Methanotrichaceae archaeon]
MDIPIHRSILEAWISLNTMEVFITSIPIVKSAEEPTPRDQNFGKRYQMSEAEVFVHCPFFLVHAEKINQTSQKVVRETFSNPSPRSRLSGKSGIFGMFKGEIHPRAFGKGWGCEGERSGDATWRGGVS